MNQNQFRLTTIARWSHPFSISNRKVKRLSADDSGLRACESRSSSGTIYQTPYRQLYGVFAFSFTLHLQVEEPPLSLTRLKGFFVSPLAVEHTRLFIRICAFFNFCIADCGTSFELAKPL